MGGALLEHFWWGSVFLIDVPIIALLVVTAPFLLPEYRDSSPGRIGLTSVALSLVAMIPLIYGIKELAKYGLDPVAGLALLIGITAGAVFLHRQTQLDDPLVDVSLFRNRAFTGAATILLLGSVTVGGVYLFITQYLQLVENLSPSSSGLWLLPPAAGLVIMSTLTPTIARRVRPGYVVAGGQARVEHRRSGPDEDSRTALHRLHKATCQLGEAPGRPHLAAVVVDSRLPADQVPGRPTDTILCDSIRRFKGLEREVVVLVEVDPSDPRVAQLLYVGATRARQHLVVIGARER
jgi:hypothetical protein